MGAPVVIAADLLGCSTFIGLVSLIGSQLSSVCLSDGTALVVVHLLAGLSRIVIGHAGTGRDQATLNDVYFQTTQLVALAHDGRLGQHAGRFL